MANHSDWPQSRFSKTVTVTRHGGRAPVLASVTVFENRDGPQSRFLNTGRRATPGRDCASVSLWSWWSSLFFSMVQESQLPEDFYSLPFGQLVATCLAALDVEDASGSPVPTAACGRRRSSRSHLASSWPHCSSLSFSMSPLASVCSSAAPSAQPAVFSWRSHLSILSLLLFES